uniref:Uncharacterized protein n=1 Tax=Knipowitschia caucasica TaxID=637954 RepID=A0AAV2M383_KNICA
MDFGLLRLASWLRISPIPNPQRRLPVCYPRPWGLGELQHSSSACAAFWKYTSMVTIVTTMNTMTTVTIVTTMNTMTTVTIVTTMNTMTTVTIVTTMNTMTTVTIVTTMNTMNTVTIMNTMNTLNTLPS